MNVTDWLGKVINTFETDGSVTARITLVLIEQGETYDTWFPPFDVDSVARDIDARLRDIELEFSANIIPCQLIAETAERNGHRETLSRLPMRIMGKAKKGEGSREAAISAQGVVFDNAATTMEKLLRLCNTQLDAARMNTEVLNTTILEMTTLLKVYRTREAFGDGDDGKLSPVAELLNQHGGQALTLLTELLAHKVKSNNN